MLSVRWRKVLRDIWGNRSRTCLVVLSMAVGVFGVGVMASSRAVLSRELNTAYAAIHPAHAEVYSEPFDESLVETIRQTPGVMDAEGRTSLGVRLFVEPDREYTLELRVIPDYKDMRVSKVQTVSGDWPPPARQMLLERQSIDYIGVGEGDSVLIEGYDGEKHRMQIAGVVHDLNASSAALTGLTCGYITLDTLEWLGQKREFTQLNVRVAGDPQDSQAIQQVVDRVIVKIERSGRRVYGTFVREPGSHPADGLLSKVLLLLGAVTLVALLLSGFLVINIISAVLAQQVRQIGMMKAIGARTHQIVAMYMGMVLTFALLALVVAIPLSLLGTRAFVGMLAGIFNVDPAGFNAPSSVLALQLGVGLAVPLVAALYPVLTGTHLSVLQAISHFGLGTGRFGTSVIDRLCASHRLSGLPRPWLLAARNTLRRKARLAFTLMTLITASTTFVGVFGARASLLRTFDVALAYWQYDLGASFSRPYRVNRIQREALRVPGVVSAESWSYAPVRRLHPDGSLGKEMAMVALPPRTRMIKPILLQGRWLLPDDSHALVINSDVLKEEPDIRLGDEVRLKVEEHETTWRVVGVVLGVMTGPILYANQPYFAYLSHDVGRASWVQVVTERHDVASQTQVAKALEAHLESTGMQVTSTAIVADTRSRVTRLLNVFTAILSVSSALLAIVGALGLAGTMSLNVWERIREIGVMRAVGASDGALRQIVMGEGMLIGVLGWLLGSLLAWPLGMALTYTVGVYLLRTPLQYAFSVGGALLWLVMIVVLAALASYLPARAATRLTVAEVLAYE